ncbi:hypothetical protein ABZW49_20930 [Nonomuraea wenchangensis]
MPNGTVVKDARTGEVLVAAGRRASRRRGSSRGDC